MLTISVVNLYIVKVITNIYVPVQPLYCQVSLDYDNVFVVVYKKVMKREVAR